MIENWEFCNLLGIFRRIGFKARLVDCREAAYLNNCMERIGKKRRLPPAHAGVKLHVELSIYGTADLRGCYGEKL